MEHRSGLIVDATVTPADGHGERDAAVVMIERDARAAIGSRSPPTRATTRATSSPICARCTSRRTSRSTRRGRRSAIDGRTTRHPGYAISQQKRKLVEQGFGWMKTIGGPAQAAPSRRTAGRLDLHLHRGGLQHRPAAPIAGGAGVRSACPDAVRLRDSISRQSRHSHPRDT